MIKFSQGKSRHCQLRFRAVTIAVSCALGAMPVMTFAVDNPLGASESSDAGKDAKSAALEPIIVTGVSDPVVAPATPFAEGVIGSDEIRNISVSTTTTAQTLLTQEPSIFVTTNGPNGVETNLYFRSFNSGQFSETFDGIAINDLFNGGVTGQAENRNNVLVTPNNLGAVQLYRGINSPAVNSYNSLGGTVNFVPRAPGESFRGEVGVAWGSFQSYDWHATVDTGNWNGVKQIISFQQSGSQGWVQHAPDYNNNLYWGASFSPTADLSVKNTLLYNNNRGWAIYNMPLPLLAQNGDSYQWPRDWTNARLHDQNWMDIVEAKYQVASGVHFDNKLYFGRNEYLRTSFSNPAYQQSATQPYALEDTPNGYPFWLSYPNGPTYDPVASFGSPQAGADYHFYGYTTDAVGDTPTLTVTLPGHEIVLGANWSRGRLYSREYWYGSDPMPQIVGYNDTWDEHDTRTMFSAFAQDALSFHNDKVHVTPGVKFVSARTADNDAVGIYYPISGTVSDTEHFVSPTLGANWEVSDGLNVFAAWGKNTKLPDISAYYGAFQTNAAGANVINPPQVKPEYVNDIELGMRFHHERYSVEFNAYRESFLNTFVQSSNPTTQLTTFGNGGSSVYQGLELQIRDDYKTGLLPGRMSSYLSAAWNRAYFTSSFVSDYTGGNGVNSNAVAAGSNLAGVPQTLISAGSVWTSNGWRVEAQGRYIGRQYIDQSYSTLPSVTYIGGHVVVNLGIAKTIPLEDAGALHGVRLGLNLDNLFDRHYLTSAFTDQDVNGNDFVRGSVAAPRSIMGSASFTF